MSKCLTCNGTGRGLAGGNCSGCRGTGQVGNATSTFQAFLVLAVVAFGIYLFLQLQ